ncbi:MAG TPA: co-chaperone GroES [Chloroflexota bacterium]|nr:co-chaperone GroES [Chloroflexota bacterium]
MSTHPKPLGDRILVKPLSREETTKSGIVLPDTAKERPQQGTVVAVGSGARLKSGELRPLEVKEGQRVLFAKYSGTEFKIDNEEYLFLREPDVLAVIEE